MADDVINEVGFSGNEVGNEIVEDYFSEKTIVDTEDQPEKGKKKEDDEESKESGKKISDKKNGEEKDPFSKLSGFASSRFVKKGEDGSSTFDTEGAMSFLQPKNRETLSFKYEPKVRAPEKKEPVTDGQMPEETNPYKKRIAEKREYEKKLIEQANMWPNKYTEAVKQGYSPDEAIRYANHAVSRWHEEQIADWLHERELADADQRGNEEMTAKELKAAAQTAAANEQPYINHFGGGLDGKKQYEEFMFGSMGKDGKWVKGYAQDYIYKQFENMNPGSKNPSGEDYSRWWNKFASDPSNLAMVFEHGMYRLMLESFPHLIQQGVSVHKENERQKGMAQRRAPGVRGAAPSKSGSDMPDIVEQFLAPPGNMGDIQDTI